MKENKNFAPNYFAIKNIKPLYIKKNTLARYLHYLKVE
jgi:hypothetical protein